MALWLKGAIEEIDCEGEGCPFCSYQIYKVDWQKIASNFYLKKLACCQCMQESNIPILASPLQPKIILAKKTFNLILKT